MLLFCFLLGFAWGLVAGWAVAYWCHHSDSPRAAFVRQVLNIGGPDGNNPPPPRP